VIGWLGYGCYSGLHCIIAIGGQAPDLDFCFWSLGWLGWLAGAMEWGRKGERRGIEMDGWMSVDDSMLCKQIVGIPGSVAESKEFFKSSV